MKLVLMGLTIGTFLALVSGTAHAYGTPTVADTTYNTSSWTGQANTATTTKASIKSCPFRDHSALTANTNPRVDRFGNVVNVIEGNH